MDKLFVSFLPPWVETNIQPAFYDKKSGTVLQQTARMYAKVNCLVRMFNKLSKETKETVDEYIAKFVELKDFVDTYFENLDVQKEINNKLDGMVEDGTLQEIIGEYLNATAVWGFDTVADMTASTNLINGSYARTLGFSSKNDGGGALYKIRTITNDDVVDGSFIIEMNDSSNELIAEYIIDGDVYVEQLGALGLADSTSKIQHIIDYSISNSFAINFGHNDYNITSIDFKNSTAKFDGTNFVAIGDENDIAIKFTSPSKGSEYSNFILTGNANTGIKVSGAKNLVLNNIKVLNCKLGIDIAGDYEVTVSNSVLVNTSDIADSIGMRIYKADDVVSNVVIQGFRTGVRTEGSAGFFDKVHIWSTNPDTVINSIGFDLRSTANLDGCYIDTCRIGIKIRESGKNIVLNNCLWYWNPTYYTDEILDGLQTYLFDFVNAESTRGVSMILCHGSKPATVTSVKFSNISVDDWLGLGNIYSTNHSLLNIDDMPIGRITPLAPENFTLSTDSKNRIVTTESGTNIDFVAKFNNDAPTNTMLTIGNLDAKAKFLTLPYNGYVPYCDTEWSAPSGFVYFYIQNNGDITVQSKDFTHGKWVKIHFSSCK